MAKPTIEYYGNGVNIKSGMIGQFLKELTKAARERDTRIHFFDSSAIPDPSYMFRHYRDTAEMHQRKEVYAKIGKHTVRMDFIASIDTDLGDAEKLMETGIGLAQSEVIVTEPQTIMVFNPYWKRIASFYATKNHLRHVYDGQESFDRKDNSGKLAKDELPLIQRVLRETLN
jgi:hypothetical protein